jgi:hypothetical protein
MKLLNNVKYQNTVFPFVEYEVPEIINESCVVGYAHEGYLPEQEAGSSQTYSLQ